MNPDPVGLAAARERVRRWISLRDPGEAAAVYYALYHPPQRTQLFLHHDASGSVDGFLAVCQTGRDLFRPVVVLRAAEPPIAVTLLQAGLVPGRPYIVQTTSRLASVLEVVLEVNVERRGAIFALDPTAFRPLPNVLVQPAPGPDRERWRFVIRSQGRVTAEAGINWRSPFFAELYVWVRPQARGRGWGRAVLSACTASLLESQVLPLYVAEEGNEASIRLAETVGYRDTGRREVEVEGVCRRRTPQIVRHEEVTDA